jgi:hypothetical protein
MRKFSQINEAKTFLPDPTLIKKYAARIIPYYVTGEIPLKDTKLIDEWLEMYKSKDFHKNENIVCDLEIMAVKLVIDNPLTNSGYEQLKVEIDNKCPKLERFLRQYLTPKLK